MSEIVLQETFGKLRVKDWCEANVVQPNGEPVFGQDVVPNAMLLDTLEAVAREFGNEDETVIIQSIVAARFRDPVLFGETVEYEAEVVQEDKRYTAIDFSLRVPERGSLVANGTLNLTIK